MGQSAGILSGVGLSSVGWAKKVLAWSKPSDRSGARFEARSDFGNGRAVQKIDGEHSDFKR